jgi:hypothetical protein
VSSMLPAWLWTIFAVVGGGACAHNAYDAWLDLRALGHARNGRRMIARNNLRSQAIYVVMFTAFGLPGIIIVFQIMPPSETRGAITVWALVVGMICAAVNSTLDRLAKRKLLSSYADRFAGEAAERANRLPAEQPERPPDTPIT